MKREYLHDKIKYLIFEELEMNFNLIKHFKAFM